MDQIDAGVDAGSSEGLIGPEGGTVTGPGGASLTVPPNALTSRIAFAVTLAGASGGSLDAGLLEASPVYAITPHGTHFAVPATVHLPFDAGALPGGDVPALYQAEVGAGFVALTGAHQTGAAMEAAVTDLSFFVVGGPALRLDSLSKNCGRNALDGKLYCWGNIAAVTVQPQGGDVSRPTLVLGGRAFGQFAFGGSVICGISGLETWCAGDNTSGALGDGTTTSSADGVKVQLPAGIFFGQVAVGDNFACGLDQSTDKVGAIYCWGDNLRGQLGNGLGGSLDKGSLVPVQVVGGKRYVSVAAGYVNACAVRTTGEVDCWGDDAFAQMGHGRDLTLGAFQPTPYQVPGVKLAIGTTSLTTTGGTICGVTPDAGAVCWGLNGSGQTGDGTHGTGGTGPDDYKVPTTVLGGLSFASVYGGFQSCGLTTAGEAYCWGYLDPSTPKQTTPRRVVEPNLFSSLSNSCGISRDDQLTSCWGDNSEGQFGLGTTNPSSSVTPVRLPYQ